MLVDIIHIENTYVYIIHILIMLISKLWVFWFVSLKKIGVGRDMIILLVFKVLQRLLNAKSKALVKLGIESCCCWNSYSFALYKSTYLILLIYYLLSYHMQGSFFFSFLFFLKKKHLNSLIGLWVKHLTNKYIKLTFTYLFIFLCLLYFD